MSKFKSYAERVNTIAKAAFEAYQEAAEKAAKAEARYNDIVRSKPTTYEAQARAARAKADMLEAQQGVREAKNYMQSEIASVHSVGRELQEAVYREYSAKGEEVDLATLELMKSGILKPREYFTLYETAKNNGNNTMCRLIGKYCGEAASEAPTNELQAQMNKLATTATIAPGREHLDAFNVLEDAYTRTANNPSMIPHWEQITDSVIANF